MLITHTHTHSQTAEYTDTDKSSLDTHARYTFKSSQEHTHSHLLNVPIVSHSLSHLVPYKLQSHLSPFTSGACTALFHFLPSLHTVNLIHSIQVGCCCSLGDKGQHTFRENPLILYRCDSCHDNSLAIHTRKEKERRII